MANRVHVDLRTKMLQDTERFLDTALGLGAARKADSWPRKQPASRLTETLDTFLRTPSQLRRPNLYHPYFFIRRRERT